MLLRAILLTALLTGLAGGLVMSVLQMVRIDPLIREAQRYEAGAAADMDAASAAVAVWEDEARPVHVAKMVARNVTTGIGFALLLVAGYVRRGRTIDGRRGMAWGCAGFAALCLAPAFGLPPELPGFSAPDAPLRQVWWLGTVMTTASALALFAFRPKIRWALLGAALLILPHAIGAPKPEGYTSAVPAEMASEFATASLTVSALFWLVLGGASGWLFRRLSAVPDTRWG